MNLLLTATLLLASVLPNANAADMGPPGLRGVDIDTAAAAAAAAADGAVASRRRRQLQNSLGDWDVSAGVMEWGEEAEKGDESSVEQLDEELEEEEEEMEWGEEVEKGDESSSFEQLDELEEGEDKQEEEEEEEEEEVDESLVEQLEELELEEVKEEMAAAHLRSVSYYCGCPSCTQATLNQIAGGYSCGARIDWVMKNKGMSQVSACKLVANEYPSICGKCHADRCGSVTPPAPAPSNGVSAGVMTDRDRSWLKEHNDRRSFYHTRMGRSYRPLKWSAYLKDSAQKWANHLAATGTFGHSSGLGENLASHTDSNGYNRSTSSILTRWVEEEMNTSRNGHMTQVLWRATEYVGCGEARRGNKFYQVCQYSKPGNCFTRSRSNFWPDVLADDSPCAGKRLLY